MDIINLMWMIVITYVIVQAIALLHASGRQRIFVALPLAVMIPIYGMAVVLFVRESNLWPFCFIIASPIALLYVVIIFLLTLSAKPADD